MIQSFTSLRMVIFSALFNCTINVSTYIYRLQKTHYIVGVDELDDPNLSLVEALNDTDRIDYYHRHICYVQAAIK